MLNVVADLDRPVGVTEIAKARQRRASTVHEALSRLKRLGLVRNENRLWTITDEALPYLGSEGLERLLCAWRLATDEDRTRFMSVVRMKHG